MCGACLRNSVMQKWLVSFALGPLWSKLLEALKWRAHRPFVKAAAVPLPAG